MADEGVGRLGAPPVELGPAVAPVLPVPLDDPRGHVPVAVVGVLTAQGELPAHVGLELERALTALERGPVQRTPGAAREPGAVEEDAGPVHHPGHPLVSLVGLPRAALDPLTPELPLLG